MYVLLPFPILTVTWTGSMLGISLVKNVPRKNDLKDWETPGSFSCTEMPKENRRFENRILKVFVLAASIWLKVCCYLFCQHGDTVLQGFKEHSCPSQTLLRPEELCSKTSTEWSNRMALALAWQRWEQVNTSSVMHPYKNSPVEICVKRQLLMCISPVKERSPQIMGQRASVTTTEAHPQWELEIR